MLNVAALKPSDIELLRECKWDEGIIQSVLDSIKQMQIDVRSDDGADSDRIYMAAHFLGMAGAWNHISSVRLANVIGNALPKWKDDFIAGLPDSYAHEIISLSLDTEYINTKADLKTSFFATSNEDSKSESRIPIFQLTDGQVDILDSVEITTSQMDSDYLRAIIPALESSTGRAIDIFRKKSDYGRVTEILNRYSDELSSINYNPNYSFLIISGLELLSAVELYGQYPEIDTESYAALRKVSELHRNLVLSTGIGRAHLMNVENYNVEAPNTTGLREAALALTNALSAEKIITERVEELLFETFESLATSKQMDQPDFVGVGTTRNLITTVVGGAVTAASAVTLGVPGALLASAPMAAQSLEKLRMLRDRSDYTDERQKLPEYKYSRMLHFVLLNEKEIRILISNNIRFRWILNSIDWLKQS